MYNKAYKIRVVFIFLMLVIVLLVSWLAVEPSERLVCTLVHGWTRSERTLTVPRRLMWHSDIQTTLNIYGDVVACVGIGQPTELRW